MERKEFLHLFGVGATLLFAGCLGGCAVSQPQTGPTAAAATPVEDPILNLTLDLTDPKQAALQDLRRGFVYLADGRVIVAKTMSDTYLAVSAVCPHAGETLRYLRRQDQFACPAHGSLFKSTGALVDGPSTHGVRPYQVTRVGNILHIQG
jgi:cytochrome b6-f complex iron-sulfur subunit